MAQEALILNKSPALSVPRRRHSWLVCVAACVALLANLDGCALLTGTSCSGGHRSGGSSLAGSCSDATHYLACVGGEGWERDEETACPAEAPFCTASRVPGEHACRSQDEAQCLLELPNISGTAWQTGDMNGDGLTDLAYLSGDTLMAALATPAGGYAAPIAIFQPVPQFRLVHLSRSQSPDLLIVNTAGELWAIPGAGDGTYPGGAAKLLLAGTLALLGVGDLDGDGLDDLVLQDAQQAVTTLSSAAHFAASHLGTPTPADLKQAVVADTDGDGAPELLLGNSTGVTEVYKKRAEGLWAAAPERLTGQVLAARDLNADGAADVLLNGPDSLVVELGRRDGTFVVGQTFPGRGAVAADLNADGALDVELIRPGALVQLRGHGDGTFEERAPLNISAPSELMVSNTSSGTGLVVGSYQSASLLSAACLSR